MYLLHATSLASAPHNHLATGPYCRVKLSGSGRVVLLFLSNYHLRDVSATR